MFVARCLWLLLVVCQLLFVVRCLYFCSLFLLPFLVDDIAVDVVAVVVVAVVRLLLLLLLLLLYCVWCERECVRVALLSCEGTGFILRPLCFARRRLQFI